MANTLQLAYLGPPGSHSHHAALRLSASGIFSELSAELTPLPSLHRLMTETEAGKVDLCLLPLENALEGSINEVLEALGLAKHRLLPQAEILVPVIHCLIRKETGAAENIPVKTVLSHPQALAQCRETLVKLLGEGVRFETASSTSEAVRLVSESANTGLAAVGTEAAAEIYQLKVMGKDISDAPNNLTRFFLLSGESGTGQLPMLDKYPKKTSLCIGLQDKPGSLVDVLLIFKAYGINMTRIESRPSKKRFGEYLFYIDVDGDLTAHRQAMAYLEGEATYFRRMGPYASLGTL